MSSSPVDAPMDSPADNPSAGVSTVPPPSPTTATAAASATAAAATTTTAPTTTTTLPASGDRPSETSAGPIRGVRRSPRAHLSRGANSGRRKRAVRQQSADPSAIPSSASTNTSLVLAPRNSMPWSRPSVPIEITPELVGDVPPLGGAQGPLRMRVYACLLERWRSGGVGRRRRPHPNVRLSLRTLGEIPEEEEELREEVAWVGAVGREREAARKRARSRPDRPAEAARERRRTRARAQGQPEESAMGLGDLGAAVRRAESLFHGVQEGTELFQQGLADVAALLLTESLRTGGERELRRISEIQQLSQNTRQQVDVVWAWLEGFLRD
ncbi:uncharacterized protein MEPE_05065 [Melanopsichium pennsylvanicum]|uniref:Uncharacterized protein n=1 Tax=Melanopsichium pennsylvanicum TaxID=63383 RepID=A0AAJ5C6Y6_9BASI|nr:uncharacterized protein MEPE_05065 [Melanopsichium pennsylvanicum]